MIGRPDYPVDSADAREREERLDEVSGAPGADCAMASVDEGESNGPPSEGDVWTRPALGAIRSMQEGR